MSGGAKLIFNPAPGWPKPPPGWVPPKGWVPDPSWPPPPAGWQLWIGEDKADGLEPTALTQKSATMPVQGSKADTQQTNSDQRLALLEVENAALRARLEELGSDAREAIVLNDERVLQNVGVYRYHHPLENAVAFKERLDAIWGRIAEMIKSDAAIEKSNMFTFDGSLAKGRRMSSDLARLMLRAYNAEADNVVRSLRAGNVEVAIRRLEASRDAIANLGKMMEMRISDAYHSLRIEEIELASDYQMKKQEEREAAREERERLREEAKVEAELAAERARLDKERSHLVAVIERLRAGGSGDRDLEQKLAEVDSAIAKNDYRAANIRAGYVYVISNRGAFGGYVVKIGLTRRLEPMDRINELGDASVPFRFDLHALYFSEDAVTLENDLHQHFADRKVNWVNDRREFFFATPAEVREVLASKVGNLLEFVEEVASTEYLQSVSNWPEHVRKSGPLAS
ncbi:MAG: DUF4041 domain-containing protein [Steroidobacteraceae bacterium]